MQKDESHLVSDFERVKGEDAEYAVLSRPDFASCRRHVEQLWSLFGPIAERDFASEIARQFRKRYWELYLGSALLSDGIALRMLGEGPDFDSTLRDQSALYLEATSVSPGRKQNRVPSIPTGFDADAPPIPTEKIVLRVLRGVQNKVEQYRRSVEARRVLTNRPFASVITQKRP